METRASKKQVLEAGIYAQEIIMNDFRSRIRELRTTGQQYASEQHDAGAQSMTQETENQADLMSEQLELLEREMEKLKRIDAEEVHDVAHLGSVVVTETKRFFVSVSIERFRVNGVEYYGVSTFAPIYKAMEGKKKGDTFEVNGRSFKILDLY